MIVLRFGGHGRLATISQNALAIACPEAKVYTSVRSGGFVGATASRQGEQFATWRDCLRASPDEEVIAVDCSVDHSSIENLILHEQFKRGVLDELAHTGLLRKAVGFSSGIALMSEGRLDASSPHMLEYRRQKLLQQTAFAGLGCCVYLPNLFTLIGTITYARQAAAWAQILKARVERSTDVVINEPHARKAWASEFSVFSSLLEFLLADSPPPKTGAMSDGEFTLAEIANAEVIGLPALVYGQGTGRGWMVGDYVDVNPPVRPSPLLEELLRSIY